MKDKRDRLAQLKSIDRENRPSPDTIFRLRHEREKALLEYLIRSKVQQLEIASEANQSAKEDVKPTDLDLSDRKTRRISNTQASTQKVIRRKTLKAHTSTSLPRGTIHGFRRPASSGNDKIDTKSMKQSPPDKPGSASPVFVLSQPPEHPIPSWRLIKRTKFNPWSRPSPRRQ
ncbi:hypothetical protein NW762_012921 [Fusarium torreyae]|uniref:Uncharacterized protein n=1 Tax=Fusarium torreyae TaxID=1237075 RepID=A0A9W8RQF2_9HYPO|nr:hypothetical protein NW762_012921 [Fusarium torreyae]